MPKAVPSDWGNPMSCGFASIGQACRDMPLRRSPMGSKSLEIRTLVKISHAAENAPFVVLRFGESGTPDESSLCGRFAGAIEQRTRRWPTSARCSSSKTGLPINQKARR